MEKILVDIEVFLYSFFPGLLIICRLFAASRLSEGKSRQGDDEKTGKRNERPLDAPLSINSQPPRGRDNRLGVNEKIMEASKGSWMDELLSRQYKPKMGIDKAAQSSS